MTTLTWPTGWGVSSFEMRVMRNTRTFTSPYNNSTQVLELGGERWKAVLTLPPGRTLDEGLQREAFFDQLAGGVNNVALWHLRTPRPRGSAWIAGSLPTLKNAVTAGAESCVIQSVVGRTVMAGDMVSINGELKRVLTNATANGAGEVTVSFSPRARANWPATTAPIVITRPTALFKLAGAEVATLWGPGIVSGGSFELIEDLS